MSQSIPQFLQDLELDSPDIYALVQTVYTTTQEVLLPETTYKIIYNGIGFFEGSTQLGGVYPYTRHASVEFARGVDLSDKFNLLQGQGHSRRHLTLYPNPLLERSKLEYYLRQLQQQGRQNPSE